MKFTKEEACKELATLFSKKVEKIDEWDRTITENVDTLFSLLGDVDMELSTFVEKSLPLLNTTFGFINKKSSDLYKAFEAKYKKEPESAQPVPAKEEKLIGDELKPLFDRISKLEEVITKQESEVKIRGIKSNILNLAKTKGVANEEWLKAVLDKAIITEETDCDKEANDYVEMYNSLIKVNPANVTPKGAGGTNEDKLNNILKEAADLAKSQLL